jgi:hypothetical protein
MRSRKAVLGGLVVAAVAAAGATEASAASIACKIGSSHPVCQASLAQNPPGTLATGVSTSRSATVNGKRVNWTCLGGRTRNCTY